MASVQSETIYMYAYIWSNILLVMLLYFWIRLKVNYIISTTKLLLKQVLLKQYYVSWAFVPVSLQWVLKARGQGLAG